MKKIKFALIGMGNQMTNDHLPALLKREDVEVVSVIDPNIDNLCKLKGVKYYSDLEEAISYNMPDCAIVSVPHIEYFNILKILAQNNISTLKEKPLAFNLNEAFEIYRLYELNNTYLQICVQRRFSELYSILKNKLGSIGKINTVYVGYSLNLNLEDMISGWRADKNKSGGGAVLDMGYHMIDLIIYLFGLPDIVYSRLNYNSLGKGYTIEDSGNIMLSYKKEDVNINMVVDKISPKKEEKVKIIGNKGCIYVNKNDLVIYDECHNIIEKFSFKSNKTELDLQLDYFINNTIKYNLNFKKELLNEQMMDMLVIDSIYESFFNEKVIKIMEERSEKNICIGKYK